jgi:pyruvate dehydrogenase E1 component
MELPNMTYAEPCYARSLDWLLCNGLERLGTQDGDSMYLRLSTRPIDQTPFENILAIRGADALRADVLAGGYRLHQPPDTTQPTDLIIAATGSVVPEALAAAKLLEADGVNAVVIDICSPDRIYRGWRNAQQNATRHGVTTKDVGHFGALLSESERRVPILTVQDAASHSLAWLGSVYGARTVPVGVDEFGQSGTIAELYGVFDLLPEQLVNAALLALS